MSIKASRETTRRWYEQIWSEPRPELADKLVDQDYAQAWVHIDATGPAQVKHEMGYFRSVFPDLRYEVVATVDDGQRVWVRYRASGTQQDQAWGFQPTGR